VNTGNDMEVGIPTEPNTPTSTPPPISEVKRLATPTPSAPREDPSVIEISTTRNGNYTQTSYTAVGSTQPSQLMKKRSIIDLDNDDDDEEDLWETVDNMPLDEYRTHLTLPIAPIRAPLTEPLPAQNTVVRAPSPDSLPASSPPDPVDKTSYDSRCYPEIMEKLKGVFRLHDFRPNQLKAVTATLEGKDVFVLMPTGGGKSLCFQLPAICETGTTRGVTVVVSPLISLMNDQVRALKEKKISVIKFSSELSAEERKDAMSRLNSVRSKPSLVYLTPEGLDGSTSIASVLQRLYREKQLARFVIDEAHLISSWGRDFRGSVRCPHMHFPIVKSS
jgi:superfamily II DNA helicase RecQ